jgi:hypothetical protein
MKVWEVQLASAKRRAEEAIHYIECGYLDEAARTLDEAAHYARKACEEFYGE